MADYECNDANIHNAQILQNDFVQLLNLFEQAKEKM